MFKDMLSSSQVAYKTGLTTRRIQQLAPAIINAGLAKRIGKAIVIHKDAIKWIQSLPETRGRKKKD